MGLTQAQLQTLKTDILADPTLSGYPNNDDGNLAIAQAYALIPTPAFIVWRTQVFIEEIGNNFNGTELAGLTANNTTRLQTIAMYCTSGVDFSLPDRRQMFNDVFSGAGGQITRANLLTMEQRSANRLEKLFATGSGTSASPAVMTVQGTVSYQDVSTARNLP
jgi:hypothetical protein